MNFYQVPAVELVVNGLLGVPGYFFGGLLLLLGEVNLGVGGVSPVDMVFKTRYLILLNLCYIK